MIVKLLFVVFVILMIWITNYELTEMNKIIETDIETLLLPASHEYSKLYEVRTWRKFS